MTATGVDLVIRGLMRALSKDHLACHSCMGAYKNVYNSVMSIEQIYEMWGLLGTGIDGSYRIFTSIVRIYEELGDADQLCHQREIFYTIRDKIITGDDLFTAIVPLELVRMFFLFWYGAWWGQPEDMGFALG